MLWIEISTEVSFPVGKQLLKLQNCGAQPIFSGRRGRDHMVVGFTTTYVISVCHH